MASLSDLFPAQEPPTTPETLVRPLLELAARAGRRILDFDPGAVVAEWKADRSPVTRADRASHELLWWGLEELAPGIPVISEESDPEPNRVMDGKGRYWLVDPLDGTREFLKGTGEFTVNIALVENGSTSIGIVRLPATETTYFAFAGGGAFRQVDCELVHRIRTRRVDPNRVTVVASRDHAGPLVTDFAARFPSLHVVAAGSSLKFCMVAEGSADLYLRDGPTMAWDTAAAQCIVEQAGGKVLDLNGAAIRYELSSLRNPPIVTIGDPELRWRFLLP